MTLTTISQKGQIVVPKEIRDLLGLKPSDKLKVSSEQGRIIATPVLKTKDVFGMFQAKRPITKYDIKSEYKRAISRKLLNEK